MLVEYEHDVYSAYHVRYLQYLYKYCAHACLCASVVCMHVWMSQFKIFHIIKVLNLQEDKGVYSLVKCLYISVCNFIISSCYSLKLSSNYCEVFMDSLFSE